VGYGGADPSITVHKHSDAFNDGGALDENITMVGNVKFIDEIIIWLEALR